MGWWELSIIAAVGILLFSAVALAIVRSKVKRKPYKNFMDLNMRRKLTFIKLVARDRRVPLYVKAIPFFLVLYLISPIDIIPDFIPVLGFLDDFVISLLALFLIFKLTSENVVRDLLQEANAPEAIT